MKYELTQDKIDKAKIIIRDLKEKKKLWEETKEKWQKELKTSSSKNIVNIKKRISHAQEQIDFYSNKVSEFEVVIKNGWIEI